MQQGAHAQIKHTTKHKDKEKSNLKILDFKGHASVFPTCVGISFQYVKTY